MKDFLNSILRMPDSGGQGGANVNTSTGIRRCTLQITEEESLATTHRGAVLDATA